MYLHASQIRLKQSIIPSFTLPRKVSETEFRVFASIFDPRNGILSCFLFRKRVRNGIPRVSVPRNSRNSVVNNHMFRLFRLPRNYFFVGNSQPYSRLGPFNVWQTCHHLFQISGVPVWFRSHHIFECYTLSG